MSTMLPMGSAIGTTMHVEQNTPSIGDAPGVALSGTSSDISCSLTCWNLMSLGHASGAGVSGRSCVFQGMLVAGRKAGPDLP
jgi:hypothetical protein